tara:strand:+ start:7476 stop:7691 length:216 start_codon:yes stop_codon:yes gene_type:complete
MKTLILLAFILFPGNGDIAKADDHYMLSCEDYAYLTDDIDEMDNMSPRIIAEIKIELINATDPSCFDQDAV